MSASRLPVGVAATSSSTLAAGTPIPGHNYFSGIPTEVKQMIYVLALTNNGKWIQKSTKHYRFDDYDTAHQEHSAPWWSCTDPLDCDDPTCPIHGQGLQVAKLNKQAAKEVNALLEKHATWFVINALGYHALTRFEGHDQLPYKKDGLTISIQAVSMVHMMDVYPYKEDARLDYRFDIDLFGEVNEDGDLGANTDFLNTRNNVFAFLREVIAPMEESLNGDGEALPMLSFLIEIGRNCFEEYSWAKDNVDHVVRMLINPFDVLALGYTPAWEVWPVRVPDDEPTEDEYDPDDIWPEDPDNYVEAPPPAIMTSSYEAWVHWHWRWYEERIDPSADGGVIRVCGRPKLEADSSFFPASDWHVWIYSYSQKCANDTAAAMSRTSEYLINVNELDRDFVDEVIEIVHTADHVDEYWRIWLLTKALLLNETSQHWELDFWDWVEEVCEWANMPCFPEARGELPNIEQGRGQNMGGFDDYSDEFPSWYKELFAGEVVERGEDAEGDEVCGDSVECGMDDHQRWKGKSRELTKQIVLPVTSSEGFDLNEWLKSIRSNTTTR